jgi:hypothetical protein
MKANMFLIISRSVLLGMRNVSDKSCRENQNTHFTFNNFFFKSCRLWDNVEKCCGSEQATDGSITWRTRRACWTTKATYTHSEYIILLAFRRQQFLRERTAMSRLYLHCLSVCLSRSWPNIVLQNRKNSSICEIWRFHSSGMKIQGVWFVKPFVVLAVREEFLDCKARDREREHALPKGSAPSIIRARIIRFADYPCAIVIC